MKIDYSKTTDKRRTNRVLVRMTDQEIEEHRAKLEAAKARKKAGIVLPKPQPANRTVQEARMRREFARKHKSWKDDQWEAVVWTLMTRVQNVRFFATMTFKGVGKLAHINVEVKESDSEKRIAEKQALYIDAIKGSVLDTVKEHELDPAKVVLLVDSTYYDYANVKEWLEKKSEHPFVNLMVWPENSADLNPISAVLEIVKKKLYDDYEELPKNGTGEMWQRIQDTWASITVEQAQAEINKTHKRLDVLLARDGMKVGKVK